MGAGTDFEIGGSIRIDVRREKQFVGVIPDGHTVAKFHHGKAIVEDLEGGFLSLAFEHVAHDKHRLSLSLRAKIAQRMLRGAGTSEVAAGTCSYRWHRGRWDVSVTDGNVYHRKKKDVKASIRGAKESACLN